MENLTPALLAKHYHYDVEEWTKQGQAVQFDSGKEQRIVGTSIPSIELTISYNGLTWSEYEALRSSYENNHSNTFIVDLDDSYDITAYALADYVESQSDYILDKASMIDKRPDLMTINSAVWAFKEFSFNINAKDRLFEGTIKLMSSVFFNFTQYQDLYSQTSSYTASPSTNQDLINVMDYAQPYQVSLKYYNNALFSNIGESINHIKNKGGLKRAWTILWLLEESDFIKLLTLYRKKSGIMGTFGMPSFGTTVGVDLDYADDNYVENQSDYVSFNVTDDTLSNARFMQDSFQYKKRVDGLYTCQADILEVKQ